MINFASFVHIEYKHKKYMGYAAAAENQQYKFIYATDLGGLIPAT